MIIIIDGYNVLKTIHVTSHISDHEREQFIAQLVHYARLSHNNIFIIFDGGEGVRPTFYPRNGITVVYSGYRDSADDVIKSLIDREQHYDVLLVSTDRELNRYAAQVDVPSIDSTVFYGYMHNRLHDEKKDIHKQKKVDSVAHKRPGHESSAELDALMMGISEKILYSNELQKDEEREDSTKHSEYKKSKEEKKLEKLVKKL